MKEREINIKLENLLREYAEHGITTTEAVKEIKKLFPHWISYDFNKIETRPKEYGKYFVRRKDGKVHWETWNGSGWAYNGNVITDWMEVFYPE